MGLLVVSPSRYEGLLWMGLFLALLATLPVIYNCYNSNNTYLPVIPMQSSLFQTLSFMFFMMSLYCVASMLPCGRYYYEPEGGYVGNPWVKFSYQYMYLYLGWFLHHLDLIESYPFQFIQNFERRRPSYKSLANGEKYFGAKSTFRNSQQNKEAIL